jgi:hypothetical protein
MGLRFREELKVGGGGLLWLRKVNSREKVKAMNEGMVQYGLRKGVNLGGRVQG